MHQALGHAPYASPDVTAIVQEVVNQAEWVSGNNLVVIIRDETPAGTLQHRRVYAYEREGLAKSARLVVELASPTPPPALSIAVTDAQGDDVTALALNEDGWPTYNFRPPYNIANPFTVTVTANCAAGGADCIYPPVYFHINDIHGDPRYYVYQHEFNPNSDQPQAACVVLAEGQNSHLDYGAECFSGDAGGLTVLAGQSKTLRWNVWIQPSVSSTVQFEASWGPHTDTWDVSIPKAYITPTVFIPGLGATQPPLYADWGLDPLNSTTAEGLLHFANESAHYNDLFMALERLGYERHKTYFMLPYNWFRSTLESATLLGARLETGAEIAAELPWVAGAPNAQSIQFDLIGHSTGNLVSRAYIQGSIWQGNVRRWVSIAGPLNGIFDGYSKREGLTFPVVGDPSDQVMWLAFHIWAPMMAKKQGYLVCVGEDPEFGCVWDAEAQYQFMHDPVRGPNILPEFFPTYNTYLTASSQLVSTYFPAGAFPFGRMANPLLESREALTGRLTEAISVSRYVDNRLPIIRPDPTMYQAMIGKVYDPYTHNPRLSPWLLNPKQPVGSWPWGYTIPPLFATTYYGLNTSVMMSEMDRRLNGVENSVCLIYGGTNRNLDTVEVVQVLAPHPQNNPPYWFNGEAISYTLSAGDGYVLASSARGEGIWVGAQPTEINVDEVGGFINPKSNHTHIAGYDVSVRATVNCLTQISSIPDQMLAGFEPVAQPRTELNPTETHRTLAVAATGPVRLTLADAQQRKLGYRADGLESWAEIPNATTVNGAMGGSVVVYAATAGEYVLTIQASGDGPYMVLGSVVVGQTTLIPFVLEGEAKAGETYTHRFRIPATLDEIPAPPKVEVVDEVITEEGGLLWFYSEISDPNSDESLSVIWDFGDGAVVSGALTPTHTYSDAGVYTATVTVTDETGLTDSKEITVIVNP